jgi:NitT/TauT family transport system permease protein
MARRLINRRLNRLGLLTLGLAPFLLLLAIYAGSSAVRHAENAGDKLLPTGSAFVDAVRRMAVEPDARTGDILLWSDTAASLRRLGIGLLVATALGLVVGVATGLIPYVRAGLSPLVAVASMVPPMALLPILFIVFGLGELSKVVLIVIGISPFMMRDLALRIEELPSEQLIKAQTLGLSSWQIVTRIVVPQMLPRLLDGLRLSLGPAWLFLISAEAIAAEVGLGYRIFLVRRYLAMDVILPYVAWITTLAFFMDLTLRYVNRRAFPWLYIGREA